MTAATAQASSECHRGDIWMSPSDEGFIPLCILCFCLVIFGGVMSGLQQGMMQVSDTVRFPLRKGREEALLGPLIRRRHLTLVTLLVANALTMEALPVFLDILVPHYAAVVISVSLVVLFSEIIPQALCLKFPKELTGFFSYLMWILVVVLLPITYVVSSLLDLLLGSDHEPTYTRKGLRDIVSTHKKLNEEERDIITGTLELREKRACDVLTPMESVFKLGSNVELTDTVLRNILQSGRSRIPVFRGPETGGDIIGLILTKHLLRFDPSKNKGCQVRDLQLAPVLLTSSNTSLFQLLGEFRSGASSHLAVVLDDSNNRPIGILTLEDVLECLMKRDIYDEKDVWSSLEQELDNNAKKLRETRALLSQTKNTAYGSSLQV